MIPRLGVCYYPEHWPETDWAQDAKDMVDMGLSLVRIGEFAWGRLEPAEGRFEFGWLDRAIDTLGRAGLKIILGTPSATPPKWVVDKFPDMLAVDANGHYRKFGSRRHYCFSHSGYRKFAAKMAGRLAQRYAANPHIEMWQTDNEYGCHDTVVSYSAHACKHFRKWLETKYKTIEALNEAWGNVFWSMEYGAFDEIDLPNLTVTEPNPAHSLDFRRFSSDQVAKWDRAQIRAIRTYCNKPILHNYMGRVLEFDHFKLGETLDIASWDSYPLGFLEDRSDRDETFKAKFCRMGDPDFQAFHHDLYRGVGKGRWGVMEQQPGPVNWAPYNPAPKAGMVRLWTWEAIAHGAEFVCYFRWRQPPFAQEQMHTALKRSDNTPYPVCDEIKQLALELKPYKASQVKADIALIFDYESQWAWEIQPHGQDFDYFKLVYAFYCAARELGQNIDILAPTQRDFGGYKLIMAPGLHHVPRDLRNALTPNNAKVLFGPRTHSKTENFQLHVDGVGELLGEDIKLEYVESLRPSETIALKDRGKFVIWNEHIQANPQTIHKKSDGSAALIATENMFYLTGWPDENTLRDLLETIFISADITPQKQIGYARKITQDAFSFSVDYENQMVERRAK